MIQMGKIKSDLMLPAGTKVPDHVVLIPDGDRRWARAQGLSASEGHRAGIENMIVLARTCRDWGIHTVSAWGLSTENWLDRPKDEVNFLMKGVVAAMDKYVVDMMEEGVRFVHLGKKDRLPEFVLNKISQVEEQTRKNNKHIFNVGLDYNGPDEIMRAFKKMLADNVQAEEVDRKKVEAYLDTSDQPYPYVDLFIRTSGEQRTSGFMMWQCDYAEFYWEVDHFPAFGPAKLKEAVLDYSRRRRRFGGNDAMEHFAFDPKVMARLELGWRRELAEGDNNKLLSDMAMEYIKEQYGLSKELAKTAGMSMAKALRHGKQEEWESAKEALKGLYEVVKKNVGLALEPEIVASIEVGSWRDQPNEEDMRHLLAEKFRFSNFQAAKSARLAYLAAVERGRKDWQKAQWYTEKYYEALKDRVA